MKVGNKAVNEDGKEYSSSRDPQLFDLFLAQLRSIYWVEKHLLKSLSKTQKVVTSPELQSAISDHLEITSVHVARLEEAFDLVGKKAKTEKCSAMAEITKEGGLIIEETRKGAAAREVGIILVCQKIEHYEIAAYNGLIRIAEILDHPEIAVKLKTTLAEEKEANKLLKSISLKTTD